MPRHATALTFLLAGTAAAQPALLITSIAEDLDASGTRALGRMLEWIPGPDVHYVPYIYERGVGYHRIPGVDSRPEMVRGSSDFSSLVCDLPNTADWGQLNCFAGYCFGSMQGCNPGDPLPPSDPCWVPSLTHVWNAGTGWVSAGSLPRFLDPDTGRFFGGTRCDGTINRPYDISGDGRYSVGGAYSARLTRDDGTPGFGLCGDFFAFRYDAWSGAFEALPSASGSRTTRADHVNHDGSVVTGYDLGPVPDGSGGTYDGRRQCVWTNGIQSILDPITDNASIWTVNGPGSTIAGNPGAAFCRETFGVGGINLVRWNRRPDNTWQPQRLGRPADRDQGLAIDILVALYPTAISDDGNTIVGTAVYNALGPGGTARIFLWRPSINNGVPVDLQDYLAARFPASPLAQDGLLLRLVNAISADGNRLAVELMDFRNTCTNGAQSHITGYAGILAIDGSADACEPPVIGQHPTDWADTMQTPFGVSCNVAAAGSWPMNYQWQRELPGGAWADLEDSCMDFTQDAEWQFEGTRTNQLRICEANCGGDRAGRYRVVITNACGSAVSNPATISFNFCGLCPADFNADQFLDFFDYDDYVNCFESGSCPPGKTADFNNDGFADFFDYDDFVAAFEQGC